MKTFKIRYYLRTMTTFCLVEAETAEAAKGIFNLMGIRNNGIAAIEEVK